MMDLFKLILGVLASLFSLRAKLEAEILILRQQINVHDNPATMQVTMAINAVSIVSAIGPLSPECSFQNKVGDGAPDVQEYGPEPSMRFNRLDSQYAG